MVLASGETSSESQVPSSVVNSILRSDFSGSPFFSSFLSVFFSSFLSFSCPGAPCSLAPALRTAWPPKKTPAIIVKTASRAVLRRLGCFALMLISSVPFSNVPTGIHRSAMPWAIGMTDDRPNSGSLDAHNQKRSRQRGLYPARGTRHAVQLANFTQAEVSVTVPLLRPPAHRAKLVPPARYEESPPHSSSCSAQANLPQPVSSLVPTLR